MKTCLRFGCPIRLRDWHAKYCADCGGLAVREALAASARMIGVRCVRVRTFAHSGRAVPEPGQFGSRVRGARTYVSLRTWTAEDDARAQLYAPEGSASDAFVDMLRVAFPPGTARAWIPDVVGWWDSPTKMELLTRGYSEA